MYEVEFLKGVNDYKKGDIVIISNWFTKLRVDEGDVRVLRYTGNGLLEPKESINHKIAKLDRDIIAFDYMLK